MRRFGVVLATAVAVVLGTAPGVKAAPYTADKSVKINVMGEWAHPDDDTSIIGPCGVWHQRYGVKCGIIMVTRGEGGGNAVASEIGPALGLRRENEDRIAHFRSGTVDIFNLDRVDFFYNQSAPLTQFFWGQDETLRRVTRIIRMTQPDIYIGFTPTLAAGHGNHQQAGRYIWEGIKAAADPTMFPEQLTGPSALRTWQVKKAFSGGATAPAPPAGTQFQSADCTTGFVPSGLDNVAGVWTGYDPLADVSTGYASPYLWPAGNVQGRPAGSPKSWAQVASEGASAYPTQSRVMFMGTAAAGCSRFGMTNNFVPFQPNVNPDGSSNANAGKDDAILYGATKPDPGGLPLGTLEYLTFSRFYNAPSTPFQATLHMKSGAGTVPAGTVKLNVPKGWTVDTASKPVGAVGADESTVTFDVTPPAFDVTRPETAVNQNYKLSAVWTAGTASGYTDQVVRVVSPVEGRFHRWGNWAEYDNWTEGTAPAARRLGRSAAIQTTGAGETFTLPVDLHNWSETPQSGTVSIALPAGMTADATSKPYAELAPGADTTVNFTVSNSYTNSTLPTTFPTNAQGVAGQQQNTNVKVPITTTYNDGAGSEDLMLGIVPKTAIPAAAAAPTLDGAEGLGEYTGEALDVGKKWEPGTTTRDCLPLGVDCSSSGAPGSPTSTYAKVTRSGDDLYFFIHVRDDFQSYAVKPEECVAHWLADSVELIIDPRGNASQVLKDTANTFKLGIFPFTNDPGNSNGNGANGPCWSRDADNHQGFSTGPLASTVSDAPNAPGVVVKSTAVWVGSNSTTTNHSYGPDGGYNLEVKIPMAVLPAAVDPNNMGLNITPYDEDDTSAAGTTTLRHIDQSTRMAWSTFGSVQSDPYRWGHATLPGYTPPAGRPTTPAPPNVSNPNLNSIDSPQTIAQSARDGVPISGRVPAPAGRGITVGGAVLGSGEVRVDIDAAGPGLLHVFLYDGEKGYTPVFNTSCAPDANPAPDFGFSACALTDGSIPPWSPDMSGRVVADVRKTITAGKQTITLPVSAAGALKLAQGGSALVGFQTTQDEVQAFDAPITSVSGGVGGTVSATLSLTLGAPASFGAFTPGVANDYFANTTATVLSTAGDATLSVADPASFATGRLVNGSFALTQPLQAGTGGTYAPLPAVLKTFNAPVTNESVTVGFKQSIGRDEPLRTGSYGKTLTFTLSTTNP